MKIKLENKQVLDYLIKTSDEYIQYMHDIENITLASIKWNRLPDSMNGRVVEQSLYDCGSSLVTRNDIGEIINLNCLPGGNFDIYGEPYYRQGYSKYNEYNIECSPENSVIIWNNMNRLNGVSMSVKYATMLANIDLTIKVNVFTQKTPVMITGSDKNMLSLENLFMQYGGFSPVIYGDSDYDFSSLKVLDLKSPFVSKELYELKEKIWNEMLTRLGISSVQFQKSERLIKDEVNRSLGGTTIYRNARMEPRKQAAEKINKMFNLDIWPEFNEEMEGISYGELYNGSEENM